jgi:hypothetical protein
MNTNAPNESAGADCSEPGTLLSMKTPSCGSEQPLSSMRSDRLGFSESQRNTADARLAGENVRLNLRWS